MSGSAATHGDAGPPELLAYRGPAEVQLGSDLAYSPASAYRSAARSTSTAIR
jgi:hypothetical protein